MSRREFSAKVKVETTPWRGILWTFSRAQNSGWSLSRAAASWKSVNSEANTIRLVSSKTAYAPDFPGSIPK